MTPFWKLVDMVAMIDSGSEIWYPAESRSLDRVIDILSLDRIEADDYIVEGLRSLEESDYCTSNLSLGFKCDVYVKVIDEIPWYIKFCLRDEDDNEVLNQISFHPLEKDAEVCGVRIEKYEG